MVIQRVPFCTVDQRSTKPTVHPDVTGEAHWRTLEMENIRVRMVEYTPGYFADHQCKHGHVLLVLEGELATELGDGREFTMTPGMSYQVTEDINPHRSHTEKGAKLFIVDRFCSVIYMETFTEDLPSLCTKRDLFQKGCHNFRVTAVFLTSI